MKKTYVFLENPGSPSSEKYTEKQTQLIPTPHPQKKVVFRPLKQLKIFLIQQLSQHIRLINTTRSKHITQLMSLYNFQ